MAHQVMLKLSKKYLYQGACVDQVFRTNATSAKPVQHPLEQRFHLLPGQLLAFPVRCSEKIMLDKKSTMTKDCHQVIRDTWADYQKQRKALKPNQNNI